VECCDSSQLWHLLQINTVNRNFWKLKQSCAQSQHSKLIAKIEWVWRCPDAAFPEQTNELTIHSG
jgi:hypothetical protein